MNVGKVDIAKTGWTTEPTTGYAVELGSDVAYPGLSHETLAPGEIIPDDMAQWSTFRKLWDPTFIEKAAWHSGTPQYAYQPNMVANPHYATIPGSPAMIPELTSLTTAPSWYSGAFVNPTSALSGQWTVNPAYLQFGTQFGVNPTGQNNMWQQLWNQANMSMTNALPSLMGDY